MDEQGDSGQEGAVKLKSLQSGRLWRRPLKGQNSVLGHLWI